MKNIRVYDLAKIVKNKFDDCQAYENDICIIVGKRGVVTFNSEGIGSTYDSVEDTMNIYMTDVPPENVIYTMPQYKTTMTINEVIEGTDYRECTLQEYFSRYNYNNRLKNNYDLLLKAIKRIGANYKDYVEQISQ